MSTFTSKIIKQTEAAKKVMSTAGINLNDLKPRQENPRALYLRKKQEASVTAKARANTRG